jgi:hypothetical protein
MQGQLSSTVVNTWRRRLTTVPPASLPDFGSSSHNNSAGLIPSLTLSLVSARYQGPLSMSHLGPPTKLNISYETVSEA